MNAAVETAARAAEKAGARVSEVRLPAILGEAYELHRPIQSYEAARSLAFEYDRHGDRAARQHPRDGRERNGDRRRQLRRRAAARAAERRVATHDLFADFDVILSPSAPGAAPEGLASTGTSTFNRLWTLMGTPCVNVPGLKDVSGLPLGVQAIGRFGSDRATLEAALFLEGAIKHS